MKKIRVGVIMGGKSQEAEVSFNSGRTVCDHLDSLYYDIIPIFQKKTGQLYLLPLRFLHRGKIADFEQRLAKEAQEITWDELKNHIDFMVIALHGRYAEDGSIQGFLEVLNIPYSGSKILQSAWCRDKIVQKKLLAAAGISVAKGIAVLPDSLQLLLTNPNQAIDALTALIENASLQWPLIIKPHFEGSSLGVSAVDKPEQLLESVKKAATVHPEKLQAVLIEERLQGMEFCCVITTDMFTKKFKALAVTEVEHRPGTHVFDYDQKYMPGLALKHTPARCTEQEREKISQTCINAVMSLRLNNTIRVDGFLTQTGDVVIIDINTIPGMDPASFLFRQAAECGMGHTAIINHMIGIELMNYDSLFLNQKIENNSLDVPESKKRVAVLLGGRSHEKEISLESGRNVVYKLSTAHYEVTPIFVDSNLRLYAIDQALLVRHSTQAIEQGLESATQIQWSDLPMRADFVFLALHGGEGENGAIQGTLEMLGIPYNGSGIMASALCMNKHATNTFLKHSGFDVPKNILLEKAVWEQDSYNQVQIITQLLSYPIIIKPHDDGCSVLVAKVTSDIELVSALELVFDDKDYALIEECIGGMELTGGVIGNSVAQALPPSQTVTSKGILSIEEKFLPGAGENQTPAPLTKDALTFVQKTLEAVYTTVGCKGYVRIDCFYQAPEISPTGKERVVVLEINTLPALTPATCLFHQAAEIGMRPMDFLDLIIRLGFENHAKSSELLEPAQDRVLATSVRIHEKINGLEVLEA